MTTSIGISCFGGDSKVVGWVKQARDTVSYLNILNIVKFCHVRNVTVVQYVTTSVFLP